MSWQGLQIVEHPLAVNVKTVFNVERMPIKKRRKCWRVVKHVIESPGCWMVNGVAYMHPDLFKKLKATP